MTTRPLPKAILFDLDGTLVDRGASIHRYARLFVERFKSELLVDDLEEVTSQLITADGHGYRAQQRPIDVANHLLSQSGPDTADQHWRSNFPKLAVLAEGAIEVLSAFRKKGVKIGLVTNGSVQAQTEKLETLNLIGYLDTISISEAFGFKKPDPRIFELTLVELGCSPAESWFVGDHAVNDVQGAEAVGMQGFLLPGVGWPSDSEPCGVEIENLRELLSYGLC